jgi:hypothetical protein
VKAIHFPIAARCASRGDYEDKKKELVEKINGAILARAQAFLALSQAFAATSQELTEMNFGVEIDFSQTSVEELSGIPACGRRAFHPHA